MEKYIGFFRYLIPFWKKEALILFLSSLGLGLGLVNPYLTKLVIDKAYGNKDLKLFIFLITCGGLVFILNGIVNALVGYLNRSIRIGINFNLNRKVFRHLQGLAYSFFQSTSTGQHLFKISYDIEQASRFIADTLPQAISLIPKTFLILIIIFYLDWRMALAALALMPFLYITPYYFSRRLKKIFKVWVENSQGIFSKLQEALSHIQLIKAYGKEKRQTRSYISSLIKNIRLNLKNARLEAVAAFVSQTVSRVILGLIIFYGGYQIIRGRMTLGSLTAISIYLAQLSGLQNSFSRFFQQFALGAVSCDRLELILNVPAEPNENKSAGGVIFTQGKIEFKDVSFGYTPDKKVLENLTFDIKGGSCIGLVGPSGCGKTTLVNLISRLYKPEKGEITIDGYNIRDIKSKSLYGQLGIILQEPFLWNDTIKNNIRYVKEEAAFAEVLDAARIACIDSFINSLPEGYATVIGENACKISEGQKQRIAIARAVIKRPKILILDEALSSVDAQVEAEIINNLKSALKSATLIIISHRFSTIEKAEIVYFLEGAGCIAADTHPRLLSQNKRYKEYFAQQLKQDNIINSDFNLTAHFK